MQRPQPFPSNRKNRYPPETPSLYLKESSIPNINPKNCFPSELDFVSSKENIGEDCHYNRAQFNSGYAEFRIKQSTLRQMKRHQIEELRRIFNADMDYVSCDEPQGDIEDRVQKLDKTVGLLRMVRDNIDAWDNQNIEKTITPAEYEYGIETMMEGYEFRLREKDREIQELRRRIESIEASPTQDTDPKESRYNLLRQSIRNHLEDSFGVIPHRGSCEKSLTQSRSSLHLSNGVDLRPVFTQRADRHANHSMASLLELRHDSLRNESQELMDDYIVHSDDLDSKGEVDDLEEIDEREEVVNSQRGDSTSRFGIVDTVINVLAPGEDTKTMSQSTHWSVMKIIDLVVEPVRGANSEAQSQTGCVTWENVSVQTNCTKSECRSRQQTMESERVNKVDTPEANKTILESSSSESSFSEREVATKLSLTSGLLKMTFEPILLPNARMHPQSVPTRHLSQSSQYCLNLNSECLGLRFKTHKSLAKMIVEVLSHLWRMISKSLKNSHDKELKETLNCVRTRLYKFTDEFNSVYAASKPPNNLPISEQFYLKNLRELKEIEAQLSSLIPLKYS